MEDERVEIVRSDPDRVEDADVSQFAPSAKRVDGRRAHAQSTGDRRYGEQGALDPNWTRSFVLLRCGMGDSGIWLWSRPE